MLMIYEVIQIIKLLSSFFIICLKFSISELVVRHILSSSVSVTILNLNKTPRRFEDWSCKHCNFPAQ